MFFQEYILQGLIKEKPIFGSEVVYIRLLVSVNGGMAGGQSLWLRLILSC
jgi:hypothetical protein